MLSSVPSLFPGFLPSIFSRKILKKICSPFCSGIFSSQDAEAKNARLVIGKQGHRLMGNVVTLYWLVDNETGVILDAKFQIFGHALLIAVAEASCELVTSKLYTESYKVGVNAIEEHLRDSSEKNSIPKEYQPLIHFVIDAMDSASEQCSDITVPGFTYSTPEFLDQEDANPLSDEQWATASKEDRLQILRSVVEQRIAPYLAMDGGSLSVEDIVGDEVLISYSGNCSGCFSAVGTTLNSILHLLQAHVHSSITVKVKEDSLFFSPKDSQLH
ncbi:NifU family protein [Chlamydiifrater phoenicopteri]|uniref:NifU family protein n=1 Tax=Chlamydiifrater phoenicopteri TaxID=2681469 RepID=UPI001BCDF67E|nr:NifU family protein [Chlamydiifrater phoenicopteri]